MIIAAERFAVEYPNHLGRIALLITSDEEGPAHHGTKAVVERFTCTQQRMDWCTLANVEHHPGRRRG
jgi:succinyl-diaminopimelate desuccinylase